MFSYQSAKEALEDLDDNLCKRIKNRDFIDYLKNEGTLTEEKLLKLVLGAVNRRLDRTKA